MTIHFRRELGALLLAVTSSACVDFGFELPDVIDAGLPVSVGGSTEPVSTDEPSACTEGEAPPSSSGPQVKFMALNVDTPTLKIKSGDVVTWTNGDSMAHSVVAGAPGAETPKAKGGFSSPEFTTDGKWAYRFCAKRSVFYFCGKHPSQMTGYRVVVE